MKDETSAGKVTNKIPVIFQSELVSVDEIIRARVYADVALYNLKSAELFQGLVQPNDAEKTLNGFKMREKRKVDPQRQYIVAKEAFLKNGYFMLIDNIQAASLEQMVVINAATDISFIKLTPLVGG